MSFDFNLVSERFFNFKLLHRRKDFAYGCDSMEDEELFSEQESIINYTKDMLEKIHFAATEKEKEHYLFDLLAFLISSSNDIAQKGDLYEAAGRLYSAAYYMEEYHPKEAMEIYQEANKYYIHYFHQKLKTGEFHEASNLALKIATLYEEKLNNFTLNKEYLQKAINLIQEQIEILETLGSSKELCGKYQTLAILFDKCGNSQKVIEISRKTIEQAKLILDYSSIANAFHDMARTYLKMAKTDEVENILLEAIDFFLKESQQFYDGQKLLPLSQLYQIIKNLYAELPDWKKYYIFNEKEAGTYVELAETGVKSQMSPHQIASYYRGAALCYHENAENLLQSATCFYIAGEYFAQSRKYYEASMNYHDAAKTFKELKNANKSLELYLKSGRFAAQSRHYQEAIEDFIWALELGQTIGSEPNKGLNLLIQTLEEYAHREYMDHNYFMAGSLEIEALRYIIQYLDLNCDVLIEKLSFSANCYKIFANSDSKRHNHSDQIYSSALSYYIWKFLNNVDESQEIFNKLKDISIPLSFLYIDLIDHLLLRKNDDPQQLKKILTPKLEELFKKSPEIQNIMEIIQKINLKNKKRQ